MHTNWLFELNGWLFSTYKYGNSFEASVFTGLEWIYARAG